MVLSEVLPTSPFVINASTLEMDNKPLISKESIALLTKKKINLVLDVFDSDENNPHKPTLIFIHGNSSSKNVFIEQIKYYSGRYRVIAFDLLGHGRSTKISHSAHLTSAELAMLADAFYNPCSLMAEVNQLVQSKNIQKAHLIGWSLGGHIAYGMAVENPSLIASVTTIGSPPIKFSPEGLKQGFQEWFHNILVPDWINHPRAYSTCEAEKLKSSMGFTSEDTYFVNDMINTDPQIRKYLFFGINQYTAECYNDTALDGESFVKKTSVPLCLIAGEKDHGIRASYINTFKDKLIHPSSQVIIIKDAPHAVFKTHREETHQAIDAIIQKRKS